MNKTKMDFIADLLASKKMKPLHKERFFKLASLEIAKLGEFDEKILKEIESLKEGNDLSKENEQIKKTVLDHNPILTAETLSLFKTGNRLKWITHVFPNSDNDSFEYDSVTENAIEEFKTISDYLPFRLIGIISLFLQPRKTGKNRNLKTFTYLGDQYKTWWSEEIKNWCKENPGLHPDTDTNLSSQIIMPFKKSIEIRDGDDLIAAIRHMLIRTYGASIFKHIKIDFTEVKKATRFYTAVDQLMTGIASLFSPILKRKDVSNLVKISTSIGEVNDRYVNIVKITHFKSNVDQEFSKKAILNGDLETAKTNFISLCDWTILANFSDGTYRVPILTTSDISESKEPEFANGFTHQLMFY